ncbi:MAG: hypothetical protein ACLQNE_31915 [Thermoguttaceae bacterium]
MIRAREAVLSHYSGQEAMDSDDPYEGGTQPRVSRRITDEGMERLQQALPNREIVR